MTRRHVLVSKKTKFFTNSFAVLKILLKDLNLLVLLKVTSDTIPIIMASHKDVFCCKLLLDWTFTVPVEGMSLFPCLHLQHHQQTSLPILPKRNDTQIMYPKKSWKHPCPDPHQREKITWIFVFKLLCGLKDLHKTLWGTRKKHENKNFSWLLF